MRLKLLTLAVVGLTSAFAVQAQNPHVPPFDDETIPVWSDVRRVNSPLCLMWSNGYDSCVSSADRTKVECTIDKTKKRYHEEPSGQRHYRHFPVQCYRFWMENIPRRCRLDAIFNGCLSVSVNPDGTFNARLACAPLHEDDSLPGPVDIDNPPPQSISRQWKQVVMRQFPVPYCRQFKPKKNR